MSKWGISLMPLRHNGCWLTDAESLKSKRWLSGTRTVRPKHLQDEHIFCKVRIRFALSRRSAQWWVWSVHTFDPYSLIQRKVSDVRLFRPSATLETRWLVGQSSVVLRGAKAVIWEDRAAWTGRPASLSCVFSLRGTSWLSVGWGGDAGWFWSNTLT